ncbi:MAG: hypothetical protein ACREBW_02220 [Candidatus Micrarchaeaceae archaeon]
MDDLNNQKDSLDSLETPTTVVAPSAQATSGDTKNSMATDTATLSESSAPEPVMPAQGPIINRPSLLRRFVGGLNIYLLFFIVLLVIAGATGVVFYLKAKNGTSSPTSLGSQSLPQSTLDQLANSDVTVGEPKHTLSVQSDTVFGGSVVVRSNLQVAGALQVGSNLAINGIRVTGNSTFDDVQITKSLALTGNGSVQGQLNVQQNLNVNGGGTFLGALSAPSLAVGSIQLNGDLIITHHLSAGGSTPGRTNGTALGSGGTVSVSGSDSAGSVTINTGGGPGPGCFITISFSTKFNSTPHIVTTPVGLAAAGIQYYINRSTTSFSICSASTPPSSSTFGFDYIAFD